MMGGRFSVILATPCAAALAMACATSSQVPPSTSPAPVGPPPSGRPFQGTMDSARARLLYVSKDPRDLPRANFDASVAAKRKTDSIYAARFAGVADFRQVTYKSRADGLEVPAYLFAPHHTTWKPESFESLPTLATVGTPLRLSRSASSCAWLAATAMSRPPEV